MQLQIKINLTTLQWKRYTKGKHTERLLNNLNPKFNKTEASDIHNHGVGEDIFVQCAQSLLPVQENRNTQEQSRKSEAKVHNVTVNVKGLWAYIDISQID